jgi:hypothetical protein
MIDFMNGEHLLVVVLVAPHATYEEVLAHVPTVWHICKQLQRLQGSVLAAYLMVRSEIGASADHFCELTNFPLPIR